MLYRLDVTPRHLLSAFPAPFLGDQWLLAACATAQQDCCTDDCVDDDDQEVRQRLLHLFDGYWIADHTDQMRWQRTLRLRSKRNALGRATVDICFERVQDDKANNQPQQPPRCYFGVLLTFEPCGRQVVLLNQRPLDCCLLRDLCAVNHFALCFAIGQCPFAKDDSSVSSDRQTLPLAPAAVCATVDDDPIWQVVQNVANATDVSDDISQHVVAIGAALVGWLRTEANRARLAVWR
mgnify:CR=1 FL=1